VLFEVQIKILINIWTHFWLQLIFWREGSGFIPTQETNLV